MENFKISDFLQPFILFHLAAIVGLANLWHRRRESRRRLLLITIPYAALTFWCLPWVSYLALGTLEWWYPPLRPRPTDVGAIVVLAGNMLPADAGRRRAELGLTTVSRCRHAIDLYRQGPPLPVLVSGGRLTSNPSDPPSSRLMRDFLVEQGVRPVDIVEEDRSRTTHENAIECGKRLRLREIRKVVLVTDATHMLRAEGTFRRQGIEAIPSACNYRTLGFDRSLLDFLPSPKAALTCQAVWHEWLGIAWYRVRGAL